MLQQIRISAMSLQDLPALTLDVGKRRTERRCAWALASLVVLASGFAMARSVALGSFLAVGSSAAYGLWRHGRSRCRRLTTIAWLADGRWRLVEEDGRVVEAVLRADSRISSHCVWLRWNADIVRSMLLFRGDLTEADLRRLIVKLRIEGARPAADPSEPASAGL
jgi:hypothetical protein